LGLLLLSPRLIHAEDSPGFEKVADISPDGKFGVRISCTDEPGDPDNIDPALITAVELVSLPSKEVLKNIGQDYEGRAPHLIWCKDSNWFAYSLADGPRVTDTHVYHRSGNEFTQLETESLRVNSKGDVRNEYVNPIRWVKPGVLLLEQFDIFRGGSGDASYQFRATFDDKTGKLQITSKKKTPSKE
jgi:hypothetical protein